MPVQDSPAPDPSPPKRVGREPPPTPSIELEQPLAPRSSRTDVEEGRGRTTSRRDRQAPKQRAVKIECPPQPQSSSSTSSAPAVSEKKRLTAKPDGRTWKEKCRDEFYDIMSWPAFAWILPKCNWPSMRPVVRAAVAIWIGYCVHLVVPVEHALGNASFLGLITAALLPPYLPAVQSIEMFANLYFWNGLVWGYTCLGILIAWQTRGPIDAAKVAAAEAKYAYLQYTDPAEFSSRVLYSGVYIQPGSSVFLAFWQALGCGFLLWYKVHTQPSPATFALVLAQIQMDISLTTAAQYPTPLYSSGKLFFLPMAVQGGISILVSILVLPESVGHSFQAKMNGVLGPLAKAMDDTQAVFAFTSEQHAARLARQQMVDDADGHVELDDPELRSALENWAEKAAVIRTDLLASLQGVAPLRGQQSYLSVDFSYGRLSGRDLKDLFADLVVLQQRSSGLAFFFDVLIGNIRHNHLDSSVFNVGEMLQSRATSRAVSPSPSRPATPGSGSHLQVDHLAEHGSATPGSPGERTNSSLNLADLRHRLNAQAHGLSLKIPGHRHRGSHTSLIDHLRKAQQPVGVYESQRYMDVEKFYGEDTGPILHQLNILATASSPLAKAAQEALSAAKAWITDTNADRHLFTWKRQNDRAEQEKADLTRLQETAANLAGALDDYHVIRKDGAKLYQHLFDPAHPPSEEVKLLQCRGLFQNFVAQYHLIEFSKQLLGFVRKLDSLDHNRPKKRFWYPHPARMVRHMFRSREEKRLEESDADHQDEGFPSSGSGLEEILGEARSRDPEHVPFTNPFLVLMSRGVKVLDFLTGPSAMFALKAAAMTVLASLPAYLVSSASFYYYNRGYWATFMAQLTLGVFAGDTAFAWVMRVIATVAGCALGLVTWYIGAGDGNGNPYGLAAVVAVLVIPVFFFRIYWPGPLLLTMIFPITWLLVIGYSYQNASTQALTNATWGWSVAWRRFLCVMIGITAAWIFAYIPPSYSSRRSLRRTYAHVIAASGAIFCDVLSRANDPHYHVTSDAELNARLLLWRTKVAKMAARHMGAKYELSFRGRWPEHRYTALRMTLEDTLALLAQLNHVMTQLDRPWRRALLARTRLSDPTFIGSVLAVISMCSTALQSGTPLPQITPSPLLARMRLGKIRGMSLPPDVEGSGEIPQLVTIDVLESDNYMRYALGVTTTASVLSRLDRLVLICKTLLGETFHVSGVDFSTFQV